MLRGFYTAAQGMISQQRRTDMLTNNMANANTPGFKEDQSVMRAFPEMLLSELGTTNIPTEKPLHLPVANQVGSINAGVYMQEAIPAFSQGSLRETDNMTDVALIEQTNDNGAHLFTVKNNNGEIRYTRNGNFTLDGAGYLTTSEGFYVLDENNNPIQLQSNHLKVLEDGTVQDNGSNIAKLNIAFAQNPNVLVKEGNGLYRTTAALSNTDGTYSLRQGFLEQSNVDTAKTMTEMLSSYRAFEANQKVLQAYDKSLEKTVNEIGRI